MYSSGKAINTFSNVKILNNTGIDDSGLKQGFLFRFAFRNGTGAGTGNEIKNNLFKNTGGMLVTKEEGGSSWTVSWGNNIYPTSNTVDPSEVVGVPSLDAAFNPTSSDTVARDKGTAVSYFSTDKLGTTRRRVRHGTSELMNIRATFCR